MFCGNNLSTPHAYTFASGPPAQDITCKAPAMFCSNILFVPTSLQAYTFTSGSSAQDVVSNMPVQNTSGSLFLSAQEALKLEDCAELPSLDTLLDMLQRCRNGEHSDNAQLVHFLLCSKGLDSLLGNYLVPMLVKCGILPHALQAFHRVAEPNLYTWTSLINGYMDCAEFQHALNLFQNMQDQGVRSNSITLLALIQACGRLKRLERGYAIHTEIVIGGFEDDAFLGSTLVDMYARCNSMKEAQDVFDKLTNRDSVTWNTLIVGYNDCAHSVEALNSMQRMKQKGISPDASTFVYALKACGSISALDQGLKLHIEIIEEGFESDSYVGNTLVDFYGKSGLFVEAEAVFDMLLVQDVVPWTALIVAYAEYGLDKEVLECYVQMCLSNVHPNVVTYACILKAYNSVGGVECVQLVHSEITKAGQENDYRLGNILVDVYARSGCFADVHSVFDKLPTRDVVAWTALLGGYVEHGLGDVALHYLEKMLLDGISPNPITLIFCLKACSSRKALDTGQQLHTEITIKAYESDPSIGNALVDMYAKCGAFAEMCIVFDTLPVRNAVTWNILISAYTESGCNEEALDCIEQMELEGIRPNLVTFSCSLKCCSRLGSIERGRTLHAEIVKEGFETDSIVGNTLVGLYAKCALFSEAREVFDELPIRDVVAWSALITGYSEHGYGEEALQCLEEMQLDKISPNAITLDSILKACNTGLRPVHRVQQMHVEITKRGFGLDPCIGNSLVVVYVKCGRLAEGRAVFDGLPVQNLVSWNALIEGYSGCGSFAEAKQLFRNLPVQDVSSWTVLISGYVGHELGDEALYWFEQMQLKGVSPDATSFACSLEVCGSVVMAVRGQEMHVQITKQGFEQDPFLRNSLLDMYSKCGFLSEAQYVFEELLVQDIVSWTAFTTGYAALGLIEHVYACLRHMQMEHVSPNSVFWNSIISAFAENGEFEMTFSFILQMQEQGQIPDSWTMTNSLKACGKAAALTSGKRLHVQVTNSSGIDTTQGTALIDMYGKCGNMIDAQFVFDALPARDLVKWNALIDGYARVGQSAHVFFLYESMKKEGVQPNEITFLSVLMVCSHAGFSYKSQMYFETMGKVYNVDPIIKHFNSMAGLLGRAGQLGEAIVMLEKMSVVPDLVTWRTLLAASRLCSDFDVGIQVYDDAVALNGKYSAPFVLLSNMYADAANGFVAPEVIK